MATGAALTGLDGKFVFRWREDQANLALPGISIASKGGEHRNGLVLAPSDAAHCSDSITKAYPIGTNVVAHVARDCLARLQVNIPHSLKLSWNAL